MVYRYRYGTCIMICSHINVKSFISAITAGCRANSATKGIFAVLLILLSSLGLQAAGTKVLPGHVPEVARTLVPQGQLDPSQEMKLAIGLPLRNQEALSNLLSEIYNPGSPQYHKYLTPEQFTEAFGPSTQEYQTVV